jgi:hypothetical protein
LLLLADCSNPKSPGTVFLKDFLNGKFVIRNLLLLSLSLFRTRVDKRESFIQKKKEEDDQEKLNRPCELLVQQSIARMMGCKDCHFNKENKKLRKVYSTPNLGSFAKEWIEKLERSFSAGDIFEGRGYKRIKRKRRKRQTLRKKLSGDLFALIKDSKGKKKGFIQNQNTLEMWGMENNNLNLNIDNNENKDGEENYEMFQRRSSLLEDSITSATSCTLDSSLAALSAGKHKRYV